MNPDEEYLGFEENIQSIDVKLQGELQTWFIKRLELCIELEKLRQLKRIADALEKEMMAKRGI